jgi:3-oxoacyl-[acyl-carrier protein] reductase
VDLNLTGKRVVVTGSSRGIGLAIAKAFLIEGAKVVITSRHASDLKHAKKELSDVNTLWGEKILAMPCDFSASSNIESLKDRIINEWGCVDIVVANVGSGVSVPDSIPDEAHFDNLVKLNFNTAVNTSRIFLPLLTKTKGALLFISSIAGVEAFGAPIDYSVAKTAVISFSKNLARKIAIDGVRVNCVAPGNVYFKGGTWDNKLQENPEGVQNIIKSSVPMQRFGKPEEIANAVVFLCSEKASFITGSTLKVDGGQTTSIQ